MHIIHIGMLGIGTIGSGVYKLLMQNAEELEFQTGSRIVIDRILVNNVDRVRSIDGEELPKEMFTNKPEDIFNDENIDIIIEVIGGETMAREYIEKALKAGKSVITANKDVLAKHGVKLGEIAKENGCDLLYEASVGGGIPIIRSLTQGLASDKITKIMGIVNGTTNYILTKMSNENMDYDEALMLAKNLGFAEPDPTSDVEGFDAARKMVILSSLGFSMPMELKDVYVSGITGVDKEDIQFCKDMGYVIKLLGYADVTNGSVEVSVQPTLLPLSHPLASVHNENNAVYLYGEAVGETMFYGPGAGSMPTATAIVSDLISVIKRKKLGISGKHKINYKYERQLKTDDDISAKFYLRLEVEDRVGVLHEITQIFTDNKLSFESVLQRPMDHPENANLIIITHEVVLGDYVKALKSLKKLDSIRKVRSSYRVV